MQSTDLGLLLSRAPVQQTLTRFLVFQASHSVSPLGVLLNLPESPSCAAVGDSGIAYWGLPLQWIPAPSTSNVKCLFSSVYLVQLITCVLMGESESGSLVIHLGWKQKPEQTKTKAGAQRAPACLPVTALKGGTPAQGSFQLLPLTLHLLCGLVLPGLPVASPDLTDVSL